MTGEPMGYESATPTEAQVDAATIGTLSHTLEQYEFANKLNQETIRLLKETNKGLRELLREAEGMLWHTKCRYEDATRCPACSLESRIEIALKPA